MELLTTLRALRFDIAKEKGIAPYKLINNQGLVSLATYRPETREEFIALHGLNEQKKRDPSAEGRRISFALFLEEELVVHRDHDGVEDREDPEFAEESDDNSHDEVHCALILEECRPSDKEVNDPADEGNDEQNDLDDLVLFMEPSIKIHNHLSLYKFDNIIVHTSW